MEQEYISIKENDRGEFTVKAKLVNGTVWLSQWQMATLFNVYTKTIESCLRSIFNAGLLTENQVSRINVFYNEGKRKEQRFYNLDVLILVGFRISSLEAKAFREWVLKGFSGYMNREYNQRYASVIIWDNNMKEPVITSLN